jgi:hypothetical protein
MYITVDFAETLKQTNLFDSGLHRFGQGSMEPMQNVGRQRTV